MQRFDNPEFASGESPGSGEIGTSGDVLVPVVTVSLVLIAACSIGLSYYLWRRRLFPNLLSGGSVALLDHRVRQTNGVIEGWHAFDTPRFVPPLLVPQAQEPRPISVVEFLETEELEDDCSSDIPRALSVNLPPASAVDSRYAMYSLRELPCVTAEEIQEI